MRQGRGPETSCFILEADPSLVFAKVTIKDARGTNAQTLSSRCHEVLLGGEWERVMPQTPRGSVLWGRAGETRSSPPSLGFGVVLRRKAMCARLNGNTKNSPSQSPSPGGWGLPPMSCQQVHYPISWLPSVAEESKIPGLAILGSLHAKLVISDRNLGN